MSATYVRLFWYVPSPLQTLRAKDFNGDWQGTHHPLAGHYEIVSVIDGELHSHKEMGVAKYYPTNSYLPVFLMG